MSRTFADETAPTDLLADEALREQSARYLRDLTRVTAPVGTTRSYGESAAELIADMVPANEPVDLLVLAFAVHDLLPGRATATYLAHVCPGNPMAFALCDQGSAAPFTGLRIIRDYASSAGCRRALLLAVEQATLPYPVEAGLPARHRVAATLWTAGDSTGRPVRSIQQHKGVAVEDVAGLATAAAGEAGSGTHLVLGARVAAAWPAHPARRATCAPDAQPTTGVWSALADALTHTATEPLLVAEYEPALAYLSLVALGPV